MQALATTPWAQAVSKTMAYAWFFHATVFCVLCLEVLGSRQHEPTCLSRFDYDYKMLNKLIDLERQQEEMMATVKKQEKIIQELQKERKDYGSTYTRWGKKTCPVNSSTIVYSGYMAGAHHNSGGSGSNYLCLTDEPQWSYFEDGVVGSSRIYGVEYNFWEHRATGAIEFFGQNVYEKNAPCAVCHVTRGSNIMVPGRTTCYSGWTKEYNGYLVSGYHGHKQGSEYVCLEGDVDFLDGNEKNNDESILYFVEGICGGLPCPKYVNGRELTCVVCSI